jgi:hypothetical protein
VRWAVVAVPLWLRGFRLDSIEVEIAEISVWWDKCGWLESPPREFSLLPRLECNRHAYSAPPSDPGFRPPAWREGGQRAAAAAPRPDGGAGGRSRGDGMGDSTPVEGDLEVVRSVDEIANDLRTR